MDKKPGRKFQMSPRIFFIFFLGIWTSLFAGNKSMILEKISVYGNTRTHTPVLLRELNVKKGTLLTDDRLRKDYSWLLRLDFLKRIEFLMKPGSKSDRQLIMLVVQEEEPWYFSPILETSHPFGWIGGIKWTVPNFRGRRERIQLRLELGGINKGQFSWTDPWFGGNLRLFSKVTAFQRIFRYSYHDVKSPFREKETVFSLTVGKGFGRIFKIGVRGQYQHIWTDCPSVMVSGTNSDDLLSGELFAEIDTRDWPLYPRTGFYLNSWMRWTDQDQSRLFRRSGIEGRGYIPISGNNIIAVECIGQWSKGIVPVYERIHLGGDETVRGYYKGALAGENSLMASLEYRFPIFYERNPLAGIHAGFVGVIFLDTGTAWFQSEKFDWYRLHGSAGFGVHFIFDHYVLRGEYGYSGKGWGFLNTGTSVKF